ncbi:mediator of RNA polymerase II transcription subunit 33A-like [Telopea speciosissima]|uniref:mediator of RNA polymerase II transcription subunit 33A-like n=1 Tax=Telopea speciosissima TaxID=54955 RepID=UPI001CC34906|nr:mediator of RNA polymerase II transcription subunit 33A-like [Telopea speciosissima]
MSTIRVIIPCAVNQGWTLQQLDVKNAFLHGELEEDVYMEIPPGFATPNTQGKVCKLKKSLHGLKQSPRAWFGRFHKAMIANGYKQSNADHTLFVKKVGQHITILLVYVDDIVITGSDIQEIQNLKNYLGTEFEVKDLGRLRYFLGIEVAYSAKDISLSQRKYILDLLSDTGMLGCKPVDTPLEPNTHLKSKEGDPVDKGTYQRLLERLIYLSHARPDITFAVSVVSQYMHDPYSSHMEAAYRILKYLKSSPGKGILYSPHSNPQIEAYTDADWAGSPDDRRSTSGYYTFVGGNLTTWRSKKQAVVARSSVEAEFRAMAKGVCELLWLKGLLQDIGMAVDLPMRLYCDSKSAINIAHNPEFQQVTDNLVLRNRAEKFNGLLQRIQFLEAHKSVSSNLKSASELLVRLSANVEKALGLEYQLNKRQLIGVMIGNGSCSWGSSCNIGDVRAACWVPFDIYMETAMDGKQLPATSSIDILTDLTKTLQVINRASWQETFLALWVSALRLVQRERDPLEGPIPHLDARLCVLLSITPLAIVRVVGDESEMPSAAFQGGMAFGSVGTDYKHGTANASRRHELISSLQALGQFSGLLSTPAPVVVEANNAAAKAANFIYNFKNGNESFNGGSRADTYVKAGGNMRHLIVEACIARKLIDTSAYFWPGYVLPSVTPLSDPSPVQGSPWFAFMEGAPLAGPLKNALIATPASSLAEIEKLYHMALNGPEEDRSVSAKIICGASLTRGWNIQEYVVHFVVKLLSPPVPPNFTGPGSHLVDYMSMLNAILFGLSSADAEHILSLHGLVPEVAAALMPLCEAFGSLMPTSSHKSSMGDEISAYTVFSCAFLFLLRLWKFYRPPHEHCITDRGSTGSELTLEYLLLLRNSRSASHNSAPVDKTNKVAHLLESSSAPPVYIDSFPKLRAWYCQNQACIASTLSGLCSGNPVHQVANKILSMIYWKMTKGGTLSGNSTPSSSSISGSPVSTGEDVYQRPMLPAWEVLEATPFVLEAVLSACAHGRLSSRDLTTGLRDLVDFLPASLAAIISYFSAEITRGIWKPVSMNGVDWPSPAANLLLIESEIKEILAAAGVDAPSCSAVTPVMLPLPMAAMVSLTITFKLDKSLEYIHGVVGPALENCASGCPWSSMPVVGALWAQKVRRWHNFIVVGCSRSAFKQDREAVAQLLRSCFNSFLGSTHDTSSHMTDQRGVNGLLGSTIDACGLRPSIAPGFLYLRTCRTIHNVQFVNDVIVELVAKSARELADRWAGAGSSRLKSCQESLATAVARAKQVATLGASLLCVAGGVQLVQLLYQETIPTWLLSTRERKLTEAVSVSRILEGYAMAYLLVLSGSFIWGVRETSPFSRRAGIVGIHVDFVAGALEGNISLGCHPATWKSYVSCFVGLVVSFAPAWIQEVKLETLKKLANGLRGWHEFELALSLLERGGPAAMGCVAELIHMMND